jgi:hypothetical protein
VRRAYFADKAIALCEESTNSSIIYSEEKELAGALKVISVGDRLTQGTQIDSFIRL